ncbi:GILT-like protein F37H8.5 [Aphelenchoides besseyi]|nr:GILT-like protein F37H8.5 [Aphelenchoides besseyi]KAI6194369.1 GILT-like protein F37H8.5 [Aphelenchoides besseyi]
MFTKQIAALLIYVLCTDQTVDSANVPRSSCTLPIDFWCDHPSVAIACTGSLAYCDRYRATRSNRPVDISLAFEAACPDSQRFVVDRLYPQVLSTEIARLVNFKAVPWGLAKRETAEKVRCHHGERECTGNRLITCLNSQFGANSFTTHKTFYCFMSLMQNRQQDPEIAMQSCLRQSNVSMATIQTIVSCSKSPQATALQRDDEAATRQILSQPRFVPFISINGKSHIHMQAMQMVLAEKIKSWNMSLQHIVPSTYPPTSKCDYPSDFWCSDSTITQECFNSAGCANYENAINGQPLRFTIFYRSDDPQSRSYVLNYIKRHFLLNSAENQRRTIGKATVELEPAATLNQPCGLANCDEQAVQHCIANKISNATVKTNMLLCLLEAGGSMIDNWASRCYTFFPSSRNTILECAKSNEWRQILTTRTAAQNSLKPIPRQSNTWLVINGYSLPTPQLYLNILHRAVCHWRGGKNRDCDRCEVEATHCRG